MACRGWRRTGPAPSSTMPRPAGRIARRSAFAGEIEARNNPLQAVILPASGDTATSARSGGQRTGTCREATRPKFFYSGTPQRTAIARPTDPVLSILSRSAGTTFARASEIRRRWFLVDADDQPLGRLASRVARVLTGKHKPSWTPFLDCGDHVIVLNASRVRLTGRKEEQKVYYRTSGRPGGLKSRTAAQVRSSHPERLVESAVRGMLPKGSLGRSQFLKLKVYSGGEHPHEAQQPEPLPARLGPSS